MKKSKFIAAAALFTLASCTVSDEVFTGAENLTQQQQDENVISFGTYVGKTGVTRSGYENTTGMTTDLLKNVGGTSGGFGVFAYYTGTDTYGEHQSATYSSETAGTSVSEKYPNFMYNQQVTFSTDHWTYTPLKYWPNDFANPGNVDDQSPAAQGSSTYGGNVSFFAYAPHVSGTLSGDGITAMSAKNATGDPTITYTMPSDINTGGNFVDLLWGTANGTSQKATDAVSANTNTGQTGTGAQRSTATTYAGRLLNGYTTNVNLNKQKVDGTVGFLFKHALAKLGGGNSNPKVGFLVQLDLDDKNDGTPSTSVTGGERQTFLTTGSGSDDAWRTIVTINSIEITNDVDGGGIGSGEVGLGGTSILNLATGQWSTPTSTGAFTQTIGVNDGTNTYDAVLSSKIAEIKDATPTTWFTSFTGTHKYDYFAYTNAGAKANPNDGTHPGVTETAQSVYNSTSQTPIILYPGTAPRFKITVDYIVRTYDASLQDECTMVEQIISKVVTFPAVELNKYYTILMHLGLTGVKFTASVSDWDADINGDGNVDIDDAEDIHLPINVVKSTAATVVAGSSTTVYTDDTSTSYAITVNGLITGHTYTASISDPASLTPTLDDTGGTFLATSKTFTADLKAANTTTTSRNFVVTITDTTADPDIVTTVTITQLGTE